MKRGRGTAAVLFFIIVFLPLSLWSGGQENTTVSVSILSKHLKRARLAGRGEFIFSFPVSAPVEDRRNGRFTGESSLRIIFRDGDWAADTGTELLRRPFSLRSAHKSGRGVFTLRFSGQKRSYPLPCIIRCGSSGDPVVIVNEGLNRYALDSARAEYGDRGPLEQEAVMALAHVIRARYYFRDRAGHKGYDFCDLTHCQVYRGRTDQGNFPARDRVVDEASLRGNLFFHSCCGGRTLGPAVFSGKGAGYPGVRDWLYREGVALCGGPGDLWTRTLSSPELGRILFPDCRDRGAATMKIQYDRKSPDMVRIHGCGRSLSMAPEAFRLALNRKKGWNFLRSNNYIVRAADTGEQGGLVFTGTGLGHGAGMCQRGALGLSRRGYNRYEILEHYYPGIRFRDEDAGELPPHISYAVFSLRNGRVMESFSPALLKRRVPPGSFFKLVTALYLASEREDLFREYRYTCKGRSEKGSPLPERCWKREGHGSVGLEGALSGSCNLYFASLCTRIPGPRFRSFFARMKQQLDLDAVLPEGNTQADLARIYSGLDFGITVTVSDIMKILMVLYPGDTEDSAVRAFRRGVPMHTRVKIFRALSSTFISGTGSAGDDDGGKGAEERDALPLPEGMWGKTSTVIDGTNRPVAYGIFSGGIDDTGIIVIQKGASGHIAARRALEIMERPGENARPRIRKRSASGTP